MIIPAVNGFQYAPITYANQDLLFPHKNAHRNAREVKMFPDLILQKALVGIFHILGKITEKCELWVSSG